jgi:predicted nuclease of predicted toxin-antitoxin system
MVIILDENIPLQMRHKLIASGFKIISVFEEFRGIDDFRIIQLAQNNENAIILTEDKDFGEWVFAHHIKNISVVFLRYHFSDTKIIIQLVSNLFLERHMDLLNKFTTVTTEKIRTRDLI